MRVLAVDYLLRSDQTCVLIIDEAQGELCWALHDGLPQANLATLTALYVQYQCQRVALWEHDAEAALVSTLRQSGRPVLVERLEVSKRALYHQMPSSVQGTEKAMAYLLGRCALGLTPDKLMVWNDEELKAFIGQDFNTIEAINELLPRVVPVATIGYSTAYGTAISVRGVLFCHHNFARALALAYVWVVSQQIEFQKEPL